MCIQSKTRDAFRRVFRCTHLKDESGAELVEAVFVITLLVTLLLAIITFGRAWNISQTITRAAREGTRQAIAPTCATCGNNWLSDAEIRTLIDEALAASSVDPIAVTNFSILRNQDLNPGGSPLVKGIVVSFDYPHRFLLPFTPLHLSTITLSTQVQMRTE